VAAEASDDRSVEAERWAAHVRGTRTTLCHGLRERRFTLDEVFARRARSDVGVIHLLTVIEALPGMRRIDARRALVDLGLDARSELAGLTDADVESVVLCFGEVGAEGG
jgi:hypothetical protein